MRIIEQPEQYRPEAHEAAIEILRNRYLSAEEIAKLKGILAEEKAKIEARNEKKALQSYQIWNKVTAFLSFVDPVQTMSVGISKVIKIFSVFMVLIGLYHLYEFINVSMISHIDSNFDLMNIGVYTLLLSLFCFTVAFLFYFRKPLGWYLLAGYLSFMAFTNLFLFGLYLYFELSPAFEETVDIFDVSSGPKLVLFLVFTAALWTVCMKEMRFVFDIPFKRIWLVIIPVFLLTAGINIWLYLPF